MKRNMIPFISRGLSWLIVWALLLGLVAMPAGAEVTQADLTLTPNDLTYEGGNVVLHKQAERIGPDEWRVNVQATIIGENVEPPEIEVVFVLDKSSSMNSCANEASHLQKSVHKYDTCTNHVHTSTCFEICTKADRPEHFSGSYHIGNTTCIRNDGRYFNLVCTNTHVHTTACCSCGTTQCLKHVDNLTCEYLDGSVWKPYTSRYAYAVEAITSLSKGVTAKNIKYVLFSGDYLGNNPVQKVDTLEQLASITPSGSTYLIKGVDAACGEFSQAADTRKILVIVTDGVATDNKYTSSTFQTFTTNGGVVFTVGFNNTDANLEGMAANGGAYYYASNPGELTKAFTSIGEKLTAMVEDPMGSTVGFDKDQIKITEGTNIDGELSNAGNTIYWSPKEESNSLTGTIAYHYTVKLNEQAKTAAGVHGATVDDPVPLNNPTYFHYGTTNEMKKVNFPIPYAQYGVSTLQTTWKTTDNVPLAATNNTETVIAPTTTGAPEKIVGCDFKNGDGSWYFTDFTQAYRNTNLAEIGVTDATKYLYVGTEVYLNDVKQDGGLELIDPTQPNAYKVVHIYREVKPGSLIVSKEVTGNMGNRNRDFSFTLTLPAMANGMISVSRDGGNTYTKLSLNGSGQYTFTLKHGESIAFGDLKGTCTIQETDAAPYSTQYSVNGTLYQSGVSHTFPKVEDTAFTLAFRNTLEATIPTGVFTSSAAAMAGLLLSALMFTITRAGRRGTR